MKNKLSIPTTQASAESGLTLRDSLHTLIVREDRLRCEVDQWLDHQSELGAEARVAFRRLQTALAESAEVLRAVCATQDHCRSDSARGLATSLVELGQQVLRAAHDPQISSASKRVDRIAKRIGNQFLTASIQAHAEGIRRLAQDLRPGTADHWRSEVREAGIASRYAHSRYLARAAAARKVAKPGIALTA